MKYKSSRYAPDIYRALNGIVLAYKPPKVGIGELISELKQRIVLSLNDYKPRPLSARLRIVGEADEEKTIIERPNLADHPLVAGPRYIESELKINPVKPVLSYRSSGLNVLLLGNANRFFLRKMNNSRFINIYHITGKFGYMTDNFLADGKIMDKATFKHIRTGIMDNALSRMEANQHERLFDASKVPLDSEEAYELAKAWPSRPPTMAQWPVIYRLRCIHLKPPDFKIEVTVTNETEEFLAQLSHDIGLMLKSNAYTESIRRVKMGPFSIDDSLTDKDWDLQTIINHLQIYNSRHKELHDLLREYRGPTSVRTEYKQNDKQLVRVN